MIACPAGARYNLGMWLFPGFGLFVGILPFLFIFLVLNLARTALRESRGGRSPVRGRHGWPGRAAAAPSRDGRPDGRRVNRVFRLAYRLGGRLTVSDLVVDLDFSIDEAEQFLGQLVDSTRVTMEVQADGMIYYEFPEIIARRRRDDDHPVRG
ncbi:MAG: hypothetical protein OXC12_09435 [Spirochaetaceae bacterium]|nr:hypothetical protein [Spirochaetaceae bacterium]